MHRHITTAVLPILALLIAPAHAQEPAEQVARACESGDATSCNQLGIRYLNADEVEGDPARALEFFHQACELGEPWGCYNAATLYRDGDVGAVDMSRALGLFEQACEADLAVGCNQVGLRYAQGEGVEVDLAMAVQRYERACELGEPWGCYNAALNYSEGLGGAPDEVRAAELYERACDADLADACTSLGLQFDFGDGVAQDRTRATHLYERGCELGDSLSCHFSGIQYLGGLGVAKDLGRAVEFFGRACDADHASSCNQLGLRYDFGEGVAEDQDRATELFERACELGDSAGCSNAGAQYRLGKGAIADPVRAAAYYRQACEAGHALGCNELGMLHHAEGRYAEARPRFERAAELWEADGEPYRAEQARSLFNVCSAARILGDFEGASAAAQRSLDLRRELYSEPHWEIAQSLWGLGQVHLSGGNFAAALELLDPSHEMSRKTLGKNHTQTLMILADLAATHNRLGDSAKALGLFRGCVPRFEAAFGPEHAQTAAALDILGTLYRETGNPDEALPLAERAAILREAILGPDHPDTAVSVSNLASVYLFHGRFADALALAEQAVGIFQRAGLSTIEPAIQARTMLCATYSTLGDYAEADRLYGELMGDVERALGPTHPTTATVLMAWSRMHREVAEHGRARESLARALEITIDNLGAEHWQVGWIQNELGIVLMESGQFAEALEVVEMAYRLFRSQRGDNHPETIQILVTLGAVRAHLGDYATAERDLRRAETLAGQIEGASDFLVAACAANLALVHRGRGDLSRSVEESQRASALLSQALGPDHYSTLTGRANTAVVLGELGDYDRALPMLEDVLRRMEGAVGSDHPYTGRIANDLGVVHLKRGDLGAARGYFERAIAIHEARLGEQSTQLALFLNNLAMVHHAELRYDDALAALERAGEITRSSLGESHPQLAYMTGNLAALHLDTLQLDEALSWGRESVRICEASLGGNHPRTAMSRHNVGIVLWHQGELAQAIKPVKRALAVWEDRLGENHPDTAMALGNLAMLHGANGNFAAALEASERARSIEDEFLARNLTLGSPSQQRDLVDTLSDSTRMALSLHLRDSPGDPEAADLALRTLLRRKGRTVDAEADIARRVRAHLGEEAEPLLDELRGTTSRLDVLLRRGPGDGDVEAWRAQLATLEEQEEGLRQELSSRSAAFRAAVVPLGLSDVAGRLQPDQALVEFAVYRRLDPMAERGSQWGTERYAVYVLRHDGSVAGFDLGEVDEVDPRVGRIREAILRREPTETAGREMFDAVLTPAEDALVGVDHLVIAPDGQLNLVPWSALLDASGRYLGEDRLLTTVTSGRDLLRPASQEPSPGRATIVAGVDFGQAAGGSIGGGTAEPTSRSHCSGPWSALPGTEAEGRAIHEKLPGSTWLQGAAASEHAIKSLDSPPILHVATHGCFEEGLAWSPPDSRGAIVHAQPRTLDDSAPLTRVVESNPLLSSGIALAGANDPPEDGDNGFLTAAEVVQMNLNGTRLVVLSACETGLGKVRNGDGVQGLRRALVLAGSETQVLSLWKVDDDATAALMTEFYDQLLAGTPRGEALRKARRAISSQERWVHPFFWSAFELSGDWRPLELGGH